MRIVNPLGTDDLDLEVCGHAPDSLEHGFMIVPRRGKDDHQVGASGRSDLSEGGLGRLPAALPTGFSLSDSRPHPSRHGKFSPFVFLQLTEDVGIGHRSASKGPSVLSAFFGEEIRGAFSGR